MSRTKEVHKIIERILNTNNYYEMLGVRNDASEKHIESVCRKLLLQIHPDKCKHPKATEATQALFAAAAERKARKELEQQRQNDANLGSRATTSTVNTSDTDVTLVLKSLGIGLLAVGAGVALGVLLNWLFTSDQTATQTGKPSSNKRKMEGTGCQRNQSNSMGGKKMKMGSTSTKKT